MINKGVKDFILEQIKQVLSECDLDIRVDTEDEVISDKSIPVRELTRFDLIRDKDGQDWYCFSVILDDRGKMGTWTRSDIIHDLGKGPAPGRRTYSYSEDTFKGWLKKEFESCHQCLEELTSK